MSSRIWKYPVFGFVAIVAVAAVLYATNGAPRVNRGALNASKPIVVKVHAQWCPVCVMTKGVWNDVARNYGGRVNLVVFDVTDEGRREASRVEAGLLGLGDFFDENVYATGTVFVIDGRTKAVTAALPGERDFVKYRAAIDRALQAQSGL